MTEESNEEKKAIKPPYFKLSEEQKSSLGYLTMKRIAITLRRDPLLKRIFNISDMKGAFQWFDKESLWKFFEDLKINYIVREYQESDDSDLYAFTDFFVWFVNYNPNLLSEIISYHLKDKSFEKKHLEMINNIFSSAGFFYEGKLFYSSSTNPSIKLKITDFLSLKLKKLDENLYTTWNSIPEDIISNNPDKSTTISSKSRKVINGVLRALTPELKFDVGESNQIKKRLNEILDEEKQKEIIEKISNLITTLNQSQAKGNHEFQNEGTSIFTFQITESVLFLIFSNSKKT